MTKTVLRAVINRFKHDEKIPKFYIKRLIQSATKLSNISENILFTFDLSDKDERELRRLVNILDAVIGKNILMS